MSPRGRAAIAKLIVVMAGTDPSEFVLGATSITLGREPENELQIEGVEVSRRHCRIDPLSHGGHRVVDLGSKNGTFLNGRAVTAMALEFDDQLRVGDVMCIYVDDDVDPQVAVKRMNEGTDWLPANSEPSDLLLDDSSEESTWRTAKEALQRGPHTRSSNRNYLKERLLRLGLLTQRIASAPDLSRLMDTILDQVLDFTGFERGLLLLGDGEGSRLQPVLGRNMDHEHLEDDERRFSRGVVDEALRERRVTFRSRLSISDSAIANRESVVNLGLESVLCLLLHIPQRAAGRHRGERRRKRKSRVLGAIYLDSTEPIVPLDKADIRLLEAVAAQAAIALQNARLQHQATTDPLTELANRGFVKQILEEELKQAREEKEPLAVLLFDLDHFKQVNDTYGHEVGDEVLKRVARRVRRCIRHDDNAGRWGGEEFLVVLPNSELDGALVVADKVAKVISGKPIGEAELTITASIGLAVYPEHGRNAAQLIKAADQALYAAKHGGRNQTRVFEAELDRTGHRNDPYEGLFDADPAQTHHNLKVIFDTIDLLRSKRDPRDILELTLDKVCDVSRGQRALLIVQDRTVPDGLRVVFGRGRGERDVDLATCEFSRTTVRQALKEGRSLCLLDKVGGTGSLTSASIARLGLDTVMSVPLSLDDTPFGVLYVDDATQHREFEEGDLAHLEIVAHQLGLTLAANPRLYAAVMGSEREGEGETVRLRAEALRLRNEVARLQAELAALKAGNGR